MRCVNKPETKIQAVGCIRTDVAKTTQAYASACKPLPGFDHPTLRPLPKRLRGSCSAFEGGTCTDLAKGLNFASMSLGMDFRTRGARERKFATARIG